MPSMANLSVSDSVAAAHTYTALSPSPGDSLPAVWSDLAAGASPILRPVMQTITRFNGPKTARRVEFALHFPVVETVGGVLTVTSRVPFSASVVLPLAAPDLQVQNAVFLGTNALTTALIRTILMGGYNAT